MKLGTRLLTVDPIYASQVLGNLKYRGGLDTWALFEFRLGLIWKRTVPYTASAPFSFAHVLVDFPGPVLVVRAGKRGRYYPPITTIMDIQY